MRADGVFDRSVVLLYEESSQHVAGLILNKPTKTKLKKILEVKGFKTVKVQDLIYSGGPVNQESILLLHTDEWGCRNTLKLGNGFSLTSDAQMLKKTARRRSTIILEMLQWIECLVTWTTGRRDQQQVLDDC